MEVRTIDKPSHHEECTHSIIEISGHLDPTAQSHPSMDVKSPRLATASLEQDQVDDRALKASGVKNDVGVGNQCGMNYDILNAESISNLNSSLLNILQVTISALSMQSDKIALQMELMNIIATHISGINIKLEKMTEMISPQ
ncbi:hypothetical protein NDU88_006650 [Pleurodeles waltl]|uniref:Uncharacterized protein n=1 Tax=Pleurodeles waltl TaxID=8319 RepID=A0AAV7LSL0_PLEWA|nr:hypothetical protein NDU88_006650 [Pleurodeles waltl]